MKNKIQKKRRSCASQHANGMLVNGSIKQDGRLAPAYFLPNYKYFDQLLQAVKKTTVLILVFKEFLQTSIPPLISVLYAKGYHDFPLKNFCRTVPENFVEEPFCVSESFGYRKIFMPKKGRSRFSTENLLSHSTEKLRMGTLRCFTKFLISKKIMDKGGEGREYQDFPWIIFRLTVPKIYVGESFSVSLISCIKKC